jgi:hypothetical protein
MRLKVNKSQNFSFVIFDNSDVTFLIFNQLGAEEFDQSVYISIWLSRKLRKI